MDWAYLDDLCSDLTDFIFVTEVGRDATGNPACFARQSIPPPRCLKFKIEDIVDADQHFIPFQSCSVETTFFSSIHLIQWTPNVLDLGLASADGL